MSNFLYFIYYIKYYIIAILFVNGLVNAYIQFKIHKKFKRFYFPEEYFALYKNGEKIAKYGLINIAIMLILGIIFLTSYVYTSYK